MKKIFIISLLCLIFIPSEAQENDTSQEKSKSIGWATKEFGTIGAVFLTGDISKTVTNVGLGWGMLDIGIFSYKNPGIIFGIGFIESSALHRYNPTTVEEDIIDQYEIIYYTETVPGIKTIKARKDIDKIRLNFYKPYLFLEFQPFYTSNSRISPFFRFALSADILSSDLPAEGETSNRDIRESGLGVNIKIGMDYRGKQQKIGSLRIGYGFGTLPDFNMHLIDGLRVIHGGFYHTVYVGVGIQLWEDSQQSK